MDTDTLAARLVADLAPVRPIAWPMVRLAAWLLVSLAAVGAIAWLMGLRPDLAERLADPWFLAEEGAAFLTALVAGYAALCAGLPNEPGWKLWVPWAALGLWLATLGQQCWDAWIALGPAGLVLRQDAMCAPAIAMGALVPAVAIVALLRRGTVVRGGRACLLGALAAAALAALALRLYHAEDAALTVIVWQMGSVALFSVIAARLARLALRRGVDHQDVPVPG